jgi:hypothetical protein
MMGGVDMTASKGITSRLVMAIATAILTLAATPSGATEAWLCASASTLNLPDGSAVSIWGYAADDDADLGNGCGGPVVLPGPTLAAPDGNLTIHLRNDLPEPTSIVISGQALPTGSQPTWSDGSSGPRTTPGQRVRSFGAEVPPGAVATYSWPSLVGTGTLLYHSGTLPQKQVYMGLSGLVTKDAGPGLVHPGVPYDHAVTVFYSDIDPNFNAAVAAGTLTTAIDRHPTWFLVNGAPYAAGATPDIPAGPIGGRTLLRLASTASETHVAVLQGLTMTIHGEDGVQYSWRDPFLGDAGPAPRSQYSAELPPTKTKDAIVVAQAGGRYAVYDGNGYMTNPSNPEDITSGDSVGGMLRFLVFGSGGAPNAVPLVGAPSPDPLLLAAPLCAASLPADNTTIAAWLASATASDAEDGPLPVGNDAPASFPIGNTLVTFSASDSLSATGTATATVVVDATPNSPPSVTAPAPLTLAVAPGTATVAATHPSIAAWLASAGASDPEDGALTAANDAPTSFPAQLLNVAITVTFTAIDACGVSASATSTLTFVADGIIDTYAGTGFYAYTGDGGPATAASINFPAGLALDGAGDLFLADEGNGMIRRVDAQTGTIDRFAGNGTFSFGGDGGPATDAMFSNPRDLAVDSAGNLFVADMLNNRIRKVDRTTGTISTVAGSGDWGYVQGDGGPATSAWLNLPEGVAVDDAGNIYIADTANAVVRKVSAATGIITTIAGRYHDLGTGYNLPDVGYSGDGGPATQATLVQPRRVAVDGTGNVYILDLEWLTVGGVNILDTTRVRRVDAATGIITTVAGGGSGSGESGLATDTYLGVNAGDLTVDDQGNLYVTANLRVYKVALASGQIRVVAGSGAAGYSGDGGPALAATFGADVNSELSGLAVAGSGDIYISDTVNARIRKVAVASGPDTIIIDLITPRATLDSLTSAPGSIILSNVAGYPSLTLPLLANVGLDFTVTGNPDLGAVSAPLLANVGGNLTLAGNPSLTSIDLGSATVAGNLTIEAGGAAVDLGAITATGNVDITSTGATSLAAATSAGAAGSTALTMVNSGMTMAALLPAGSYPERVPFTVTNLAPVPPPAPGTSEAGPVDVTPLAAYHFDFATPTLNQDATLAFTAEVAQLADPGGFLTALSNASLTLAAQPDGGGLWQTLPPCMAPPASAGCVLTEPFDGNGQPLPVGSLTAPATVRFTSIVSHFSTYALVQTAPTDTTPPVFDGVPSTITAEATSAAGATVTYVAPTATDAVSGPVAVDCTPMPGALFPLGTTAVTCTATDDAGNAASASFEVVVLDTTPPSLALPANMTVPATGTGGAVVTYTATAADLVSGALAPACAPASGTTFPVGVTTVNCTATDAAGNAATGSFTVTVTALATGGSKTLCTILGNSSILDVDLFSFTGKAKEKISVRLAADPAGTSTGSRATLLVAGPGLLKSDSSALPNVITTTLSKSGTFGVTVTEHSLTRTRFNGAYCVTLESSLGAWQGFTQH